MRLEPVSPCCGEYLVSKIGTEILVCSKCEIEYELKEKSNLSDEKITINILCDIRESLEQIQKKVLEEESWK